MSLSLVTSEMRHSEALSRTTMAIWGPSGAGKTTLLNGLPAECSICLDFEAGLSSAWDWNGPSLRIRQFEDAVDAICLLGGVNPAADPGGYFSQGHFEHVRRAYPDIAVLMSTCRYVFLDSVTDYSRQALTWAKGQPEAFSERTGKPDMRGAYGLLAREVISSLKHLQHADGKSVIMVGILEQVTDEFNRTSWQPQLEGGKVARELPGIVDQVMTLSLFEPEGDGWRHDPAKGRVRRLVCQSPNEFGLPAKDRSGRLAATEPADLRALLNKINIPKKG